VPQSYLKLNVTNPSQLGKMHQKWNAIDSREKAPARVGDGFSSGARRLKREKCAFLAFPDRKIALKIEKNLTNLHESFIGSATLQGRISQTAANPSYTPNDGIE
jgi:hypothetical protein